MVESNADLVKAATTADFKQTLYEAVLVAFGKILAKYNVFAQGSIMKDVGREIMNYVKSHGFDFEETGKLEDLATLINLFVQNGFAEKLDINPAEVGTRYTFHNLYGIKAYKELYDIVPNPFLSCPLNLCLYTVLDKNEKTMQCLKKTFDMNEKTSEAVYNIVDKEISEEKDFDPLVIENARLYQLAQERADRLEKAQKEIKALRGFIPICASCKKIRDDDGYWQQVESYISEHSDALFTHSLCPECIAKLYPDSEKPARKTAARKTTTPKKKK